MALYEWIPHIGPSIARKRVERDMPIFAQRNGLNFEQSKERYRIGKLKGYIEGYQIAINVHEMTITAACPTGGLKLLSYDDYERRTNPYRFKIGKLNRAFKVPEVVPELQGTLSEDCAFEECVSKLLSYYEVSGVNIWNDKVEVLLRRSGFDGGKAGTRTYIANHYITVETLEKVLPDLMKALKIIERACNERHQFPR